MSKTLTSIKDQIISYKGRRVRCRMSKGRNRVEETEGILTDVYPKLFTLYNNSTESTISFSYAEVLTHEVELEVVN
ncbi:Veg family protein [uncultured Fretibacterium sp.]|uniref:Veg family protein n=1 Tax=uncultured Fretibacterium sp. TaxID=1678694 RepID=UPI0026117CF1|nr:Veg family protein [uncultured Fretibacterium sp.]